MNYKIKKYKISKTTTSYLGKGTGGEVELRSEEAQEVLGNVPPWILRWGISFLAGMVIILITGSWIFKYPDIISAPLVLTTSNPPASIIARTNAKISLLLVENQQSIKEGVCLAILENPAEYEDIKYIKTELEKIFRAIKSKTIYHLSRKNLKLGGVQSSFSSVLIRLDNYNQFISQNVYSQKKASMHKMIEANKLHLNSLTIQQEIAKKQHELEIKSFIRNNYLLQQGLKSEEDGEKAQSILLQSEMSVRSINSTLENSQIQISQLEDNLLELEIQHSDKKNTLLSELKASLTQLENDIRTWEMTYVLISPVAGKVAFTNYWSTNQNVLSGDIVFTVVPDTLSELIGKAMLPTIRSGKVKKGQKVNIQFNSFPDSEFGIVKGVITNISLIPTQDGEFIAEISFPDGLKTSYGKVLPLTHEMAAIANIITDDLRLIEQFIQPLKKILKNNL